MFSRIFTLLTVLALTACAGAPVKLQPIKLPVLTPQQLQLMNTQVCATVKADLLLLQSPSGQALIGPAAQSKIANSIAPSATAVCNSGASVDLTNLQTLNETAIPAMMQIVAAGPAFPDQQLVLAGLTVAQGILVPMVNDAIVRAQTQAAVVPAPSK